MWSVVTVSSSLLRSPTITINDPNPSRSSQHLPGSHSSRRRMDRREGGKAHPDRHLDHDDALQPMRNLFDRLAAQKSGIELIVPELHQQIPKEWKQLPFSVLDSTRAMQPQSDSFCALTRRAISARNSISSSQPDFANGTRPPSTARSCPVINDAASLARNTAALAMSSVTPARRIGCMVANKSDITLRARSALAPSSPAALAKIP